MCYTPIIQDAFLVVLGSVVLVPFGSPVFRLAKVCTPERNLFQLAVELTLFDGQKEETRHFYSRIFLVVSSKRKILDLGVFKMRDLLVSKYQIVRRQNNVTLSLLAD